MNEARPILCWRAARLVSLELDLASELKRSLPCQRRGIFCGSSRAAFLLLPVTEKGPVEGFPLQVRYTSVFTVIMLFLQPKRMGSPPYFNISLHAIHEVTDGKQQILQASCSTRNAGYNKATQHTRSGVVDSG
ncbi:uncharacterized protein LOC143820582 isoform X1 [Paroedura picta]|uniref:uncharacterized protein LOC143820582 isoform X1 n=1 Tax=Paroedura picta TaxID=143630 RepID=UPI004056FB45